jgi:hypothetical protein
MQKEKEKRRCSGDRLQEWKELKSPCPSHKASSRQVLLGQVGEEGSPLVVLFVETRNHGPFALGIGPFSIRGFGCVPFASPDFCCDSNVVDSFLSTHENEDCAHGAQDSSYQSSSHGPSPRTSTK